MALDPYGNIATGYTGTVHFSSSDTQAVLPANYTYTTTDAGAHTFTGILKKTGSQTITANDTKTSTITGTQWGISVNAATQPPVLIQVSGVPNSVVAGLSYSITLKCPLCGRNSRHELHRNRALRQHRCPGHFACKLRIHRRRRRSAYSST